MTDIVETIATHTGIDEATIQKIIGSILGLLKAHLPAETFAQIEERIPGSAQMLAATPDAAGGGFMDIASKLAGKVFGAGAEGGVELLQIAEKLGISAATLTTIVSTLFKFLSAHLPPEVMAKIVDALPSIPGINLTGESKLDATGNVESPEIGGTHSF